MALVLHTKKQLLGEIKSLPKVMRGVRAKCHTSGLLTGGSLLFSCFSRSLNPRHVSQLAPCPEAKLL